MSSAAMSSANEYSFKAYIEALRTLRVSSPQCPEQEEISHFSLTFNSNSKTQ